MNNLWKKIMLVKPYYFFIIFLLSVSVCVLALRSNNQNMGTLREKVFAADQSGQGVETSLNNLRSYVNSHMNTSLASGATSLYPPIQLQYTYQRLVDAQSQQSNSNVYSDAQNYCQAQNPTGFSGRTRIACVQAYVESHGIKVATIPTGLYEFNFQTPTWSPDLAGWTMITSVILFCLFSMNLGYWILQKRSARKA